jgi:hypothetical protein
MTKSRLGEDVILALIKDSKTAFSTTPKDLVDLKKEKVSDNIIQAMISAVPSPPEPPKAAIEAGRIIQEGVGWGGFHRWSEYAGSDDSTRLARLSCSESVPRVAKAGYHLFAGQPRRSNGTPVQ